MRLYILTMTILLIFTLSKAEEPTVNAGSEEDQFRRNNVAFTRKDVENDVLANRLNSDVYFQIHDRQARSDEVSQMINDKIERHQIRKPPSDILIPKPEDLDFKPYAEDAQQK